MGDKLISVKISSDELDRNFYLKTISLETIPNTIRGDVLLCDLIIQGQLEIPISSVINSFGESFEINVEEKTDDRDE